MDEFSYSDFSEEGISGRSRFPTYSDLSEEYIPEGNSIDVYPPDLNKLSHLGMLQGPPTQIDAFQTNIFS